MAINPVGAGYTQQAYPQTQPKKSSLLTNALIVGGLVVAGVSTHKTSALKDAFTAAKKMDVYALEGEKIIKKSAINSGSEFETLSTFFHNLNPFNWRNNETIVSKLEEGGYKAIGSGNKIFSNGGDTVVLDGRRVLDQKFGANKSAQKTLDILDEEPIRKALDGNSDETFEKLGKLISEEKDATKQAELIKIMATKANKEMRSAGKYSDKRLAQVAEDIERRAQQVGSQEELQQAREITLSTLHKDKKTQVAAIFDKIAEQRGYVRPATEAEVVATPAAKNAAGTSLHAQAARNEIDDTLLYSQTHELFQEAISHQYNPLDHGFSYGPMPITSIEDLHGLNYVNDHTTHFDDGLDSFGGIGHI